ncbi:hypothetical protein D9M68_911270 [compost metagenome]
MQVVLVRARLHTAEQSEGVRVGLAAIDRIHHLDAIAAGQCAGATGVLDLQVAAAAGPATVDHQLVRRRIVIEQVGIQRDSAVFPLIVIDDQFLVGAPHGGTEVDQTGVVTEPAQVRVAGEPPDAGVAHGHAGRAA